MTYRNKCWIVALVLVVALMLAGCGSSGEPPKGNVAAPTQAAATEAPETEAPETEPTENPLSLGRMEGGTYTNEYAGFACDLDETWLYHSAEELQEMPDAVKDAMDGSKLGEYMENATQLTDMMAENESLLSTVNVLYTKQDPMTQLAALALNDEQIVDMVLQQTAMLEEAYVQAGIITSSIEKVKVNFLGEERWAVKTVAETQGVAYYTLQVFDYKVGAYGVTLTAASFVNDNTQAVLDLFYAID